MILYLGVQSFIDIRVTSFKRSLYFLKSVGVKTVKLEFYNQKHTGSMKLI